MAIFEGKKSSNDITNNDTISDDEVVASYVPPRYLFPNVTETQKKKKTTIMTKTRPKQLIQNYAFKIGSQKQIMKLICP